MDRAGQARGRGMRRKGIGMRTTFVIVRIGIAALIVAAVIGQLMVTVSYNSELLVPQGLFSSTLGPVAMPVVIVNFFSFFTIQSNIIAAVTLAIGGVLLWRARSMTDPEPRWFAVLLAAATTYMVTTGIVYNVLLRGIELPQGVTLPWSNEVLHVIAPLYLAVDLFFAPRRRRLAWSAILIVVAYPIVWVIYTLVRGPLTTHPATGMPWWYPYPFLDPHLVPGGYWGVAAYVVAIAAVVAGIAALVIWYGRVRGKDPVTTA